MPRWRTHYLPVLALPLIAGACLDPYACRSSDDAQLILYEGQVVSSSRMAPDEFNLQVGDTTTAVSGVAEANACGPEWTPKFTSAEHPERFTWSSSNTSVATVDTRGRIRGVAIGQAHVMVQSRGAESVSMIVNVIPQVGELIISPTTATVHAGDTLRFDAYLVDKAGHPIEFSWVFPYPVNLQPPNDQAMAVLNWIPGNRQQLLKHFPTPGTYALRAVTVVRNVRRDNAAVITVMP